MNRFCRSDILRILHITPKQLSGWQRAGLVPVSDDFSFFDLIQLKQVRDLCAKRVRPAVIRESLVAMRKQVAGMENPFLEASVFNVGNRVAFRHEGRAVEPVRGQFVMEFEPMGAVVSAKVRPIMRINSAADLFARGVALEEHPNTHDEAIAIYLRVIELEPEHAAAHINLGTLYYNRQDFVSAENHYRLAIKADPRYALAYFDVGNVLDETGRIDDAVTAYRTAIQLAPTYADAHYNLALAFERQKQPRRALVHWRAYAKLDRVGPWAVHAHNRIARILEGDPLKMVFRRQ
jgi:predicted O-linked N-acetylglucosamine transferase (SPINDLY family)